MSQRDGFLFGLRSVQTWIFYRCVYFCHRSSGRSLPQPLLRSSSLTNRRNHVGSRRPQQVNSPDDIRLPRPIRPNQHIQRPKFNRRRVWPERQQISQLQRPDKPVIFLHCSPLSQPVSCQLRPVILSQPKSLQSPRATGIIAYYQTHLYHSQEQNLAHDSQEQQPVFPQFLTALTSLLILTQIDEAMTPARCSCKIASSLFSTPNKPLPCALQRPGPERLGGPSVVPVSSLARSLGWPRPTAAFHSKCRN